MSKATLIVRAAILAGFLGLSGAWAQAFPVPPQSAPVADQTSPLIEKAGSRRVYHAGPGHYHPRHHRYRYRHDHGWNRPYYRYRYRCGPWDPYCRPYYGGYYYGYPGWPGFGSGIVLSVRPHRHGSRHIAWCSDRYRSYNPRTNTWVAYSGKVRQCISPYRR